MEQITNADLLPIIKADINSRTIIGHHLDSFNNFATEGINQIITQNFTVDLTIKSENIAQNDDYDIDYITVLIRFTDVNLSRPTRTGFHSGMDDPLYPNVARQQKLNYSSALHVDAIMTFTAFTSTGEEYTRTENIQNIKIADIPSMVGSVYCHTSGMTKSEKKSKHEDPQDNGGYFILNGSEWVISCMESRLFNSPHIFRNIGHGKEVTRLVILSKPGDAYENSSEIKIILMTDNNIYISFSGNDYLSTSIPFYIIFKLLGMHWQKEIIDNIIYGYSTEDNVDVVSDHMLSILTKAFDANDKHFYPGKYITNKKDLTHFVAERFAYIKYIGMSDSTYKQDDNYVDYIENSLYNLLDKKLLPHIGITSEFRHQKLRYLGHLIHQLILVEYQIVKPSDRDSHRNKRVNAAGRSYAKIFKRAFNTSIIYPLKNKIKSEFKSIPFMQVPLKQLFSAIDGSSLNKEIVGSITRGDKEIVIKQRKVRNNLSSEQISRKNQLHLTAALRSLKTANSGSTNNGPRAKEMRETHVSYLGPICPSQSASTGAQVGLVKQLSLGASISEPSSSMIVKKILLKDIAIIPINYVRPADIYKGLVKVLVNGDWIGCTADAFHILHKYRDYRRGIEFVDFATTPKSSDKHLLNKTCTIHWSADTKIITFWTDGGRLLYPRLIVRNNGELDPFGRAYFKSEYNAITDEGFHQDILYTHEIEERLLRKEITVDYLLLHGIIEYISPEELENCLIAFDVSVLYQNQTNSLLQYTHCEIPIAILGLPALTCPHVEHNALARTTFNTSQTKQTQGIFALNWPYRVDKSASVQYYCEQPIVVTIANNYVYPNGANAFVAILSYGGGNMEDSLIFNQSASDRGFVKGNHRAFYMTDLENSESFKTPDVNTQKIKMDADYSKMENGFIRKGSVVVKGDGLIGKVMKVTQNQNVVDQDKSILYKNKEKGIIENVIIGQDNDSNDFAKVIYSTSRPLGIGDKFSSRAGQKGMTGIGFPQEDMPFTEEGLSPELILSPQAIPSRMTIGQLLEGLTSLLGLARGTIYDATAFCKSDPVWLGEQLEKYGFRYDGTKRMFNGFTGEWIDTMVFIVPNYYQRLQKFVIEQIYSITTGNKDIITRQPLEGKANRGGLRISELAKDVISSSGAGHFMMEKMRQDSDEFDIYICRTCGKRPIVNEYEGKASCKNCDMLNLTPDIYKCRTKYASKMLIQELETVNIGVRLEVQPFKYEVFEESIL